MFATETTSCRATCAWTVVRYSLTGKAVLAFACSNGTSFCNRAVDHSDAHLRDIVMNFMIAGRDTTAQVKAYVVLDMSLCAPLTHNPCAHAQTLSWLFYNLSRNPDKQAELLKEIDSFDDGLPDYDELRHMKYIMGAINETLRSTITTQFAPSSHLWLTCGSFSGCARRCLLTPNTWSRTTCCPTATKCPLGCVPLGCWALYGF